MADLKPCPFCGTGPMLANDLAAYAHWFECPRCHARGPFTVPGEDAVTAWNRRAEPVGETVAEAFSDSDGEILDVWPITDDVEWHRDWWRHRNERNGFPAPVFTPLYTAPPVAPKEHDHE